MDEEMREELSDIVESSVESAVEAAFEEKLEDISWELREQVQDAISDNISEFFAEGIDEFLANHQFLLKDGTVIQTRQRTKVLSPDKKKLLICYGGLRVDGLSLIVQTRISCWDTLYAYDSEADATAALEKVKDAIERGDALIEL